MASSQKSLMAGSSILCFSIFMFFQNILVANADTTIYNQRFNKVYNIANNNTILTANALINVKPIPGSTTFSASIDTYTMKFKDKGSDFDINLDTCPKFKKKYGEALKLPFKINKDNDGVVKSIAVSSKDLDLSVNLKLFFATRFQVNEGLVKKNKDKSKFSGTATEHTLNGNCNVNYDASKDKNNFWLKLKYSPNACSSDLAPDSSDQEYLADKCKKGSELGLDWKMSGTTIVTVQGNTIDVSRVTKRASSTSSPFLNDNNKLKITMSGNLRKSKNDAGKSAPDFNDSDSKTVSKLRYIKVNRNMIKEGGNDAFRITYQALACLAPSHGIALGLFEQLVDCVTL